MTSLLCRYCWKAEVPLFETIEQRSDVKKIQDGGAANYKAKSFNVIIIITFFLRPVEFVIYALFQPPQGQLVSTAEVPLKGTLQYLFGPLLRKIQLAVT